MTSYFISDCHLDATHPKAITFFVKYLDETIKNRASALYILGDFFEVWLGDDAIEDWHQPIIDSLRRCADAGVKLYFMHGNRDFFVGQAFCKLIGATLLPDPTVITLQGQTTLLMHGDLLCTDDVAYQRFRRFIRNPVITWLFLALPKHYRQRLATKARQKSKQHTKSTDLAIMDVNSETVNRFVKKHQATQLIHGHTHRPTVETRQLDSGKSYQRVVLGDWYKTASVLICEEGAPAQLQQFELK